MSCVSRLDVYDDYMVTYCPSCGERIEVDEDDCIDTLESGNKEYELWCPNDYCGCHFYSSEDYD